ncbi:glycosyltransferase [Candidatus Bathyarchaeota archaeon]|nr:glycosyltransferase [Candidatus Bathyarchaeota archaeon]
MLSVIVVTYNRCEDLKDSLDGIFSLDELPYEVIVVDSNSTDNTCKIIKNYPLKFIKITERSMVKARNIGWQTAKGDIIAFIDDDAEAEPGWLQAFVKVNPVTVTVDTVRALSLGGPVTPSLWKCLAWIGGILVVFVPVAVWRYRKIS